METLFHNPLKWAKAFVGTRLRLGVMIAGHVFIFAMTALSLYDDGVPYYIISFLFAGLWFPVLYLYMLHHLTLLLEQREKNP